MVLPAWAEGSISIFVGSVGLCWDYARLVLTVSNNASLTVARIVPIYVDISVAQCFAGTVIKHFGMVQAMRSVFRAICWLHFGVDVEVRISTILDCYFWKTRSWCDVLCLYSALFSILYRILYSTLHCILYIIRHSILYSILYSIRYSICCKVYNGIPYHIIIYYSILVYTLVYYSMP